MQSSPFRALNTLDALEDALGLSTREPVVLFKHSTLCGLSTLAARELLPLIHAGDLLIFEVVVQQARAVAHTIEQRLGIRHETPQVIVVVNRQPVYDASHRRITADALRDVLANHISS